MSSVRCRRLTLGRDIGEVVLTCVGVYHGVTLNFGPAKLCSPAILETSFSYDKDIWIAATTNYIYFFIIVLLNFY